VGSWLILGLVAKADNRLRLDGLVARAAFGVQKAEQFLKGSLHQFNKYTLAGVHEKSWPDETLSLYACLHRMFSHLLNSVLGHIGVTTEFGV
jgi:hypothetical protein